MMGEALEVAKVMVEPTIKLIEAVQSAIGKAYEPRYLRKLADAKAYELTTIGQAIRENSDIPIVYDKGNIAIDTSDTDDFIKRTQSRLAYQELTKQNNIESVVAGAYKMLDGKPKVQNSCIDPDWLLRFFNSVQDIGNTDMQYYWAKILSGEILQPGTVSLRTLLVLSQMTSSEAALFNKISKYVLHCKNNAPLLPDDYFVLSDNQVMEYMGMDYSQIHLLEEIGLISANSLVAAGVDVYPGSSECIYIENYELPIIKVTNNGDKLEKIYRNVYLLSSAGRELLKVIDNSVGEEIADFTKICFEIYCKNTFWDEEVPAHIQIENLLT